VRENILSVKWGSGNLSVKVIPSSSLHLGNTCLRRHPFLKEKNHQRFKVQSKIKEEAQLWATAGERHLSKLIHHSSL
jgi:hypothetical protein